MSVNLLEENLRAIRTQKAKLKRKMKTETDRVKLMTIANNIRELGVEENKILIEIGELNE